MGWKFCVKLVRCLSEWLGEGPCGKFVRDWLGGLVR